MPTAQFTAGRAEIPQAPASAYPPPVEGPDDRTARQRRKRRWTLIGAGAAVAVAAATGTIVMLTGGSPDSPASTGKGTTPTSATTAPPLKLVWQAAIGKPPTGSPAVAADLVFVGDNDGTVRALRRSDGGVAWSYPAGAQVLLNPHAVDGVVYGAGTDGTLHAIDAATGKARWTKKNPTQFDAPPAVTGDRLYVGGRDTVLYAYDLDGKRLWRYWTEAEIRTTPLVTDTMIYTTAQDGNLFAITPEGALHERTKMGKVAGRPALTGETICATTNGSGIQCTRLSDGEGAAAISPENGMTGDVLGADGRAFGAGTDGTVTAWDTTSGDQLWQFTPAGGQSGPGYPTLVDGTVYAAGPEGRLAGLRADSGVVDWQTTVPDTITAPPTIDNGMLYVVGKTGGVYALQLPPGSDSNESPSPPSTPDDDVTPTAEPTTTRQREPDQHPTRTRPRHTATRRPPTSTNPTDEPTTKAPAPTGIPTPPPVAETP